jgi:hypothetical protein
MGKITKKINRVFNRPVVQILLFFSKRRLCFSISWKFSFHFMTQKYQNFRCRVKHTGPKSPTLPYLRKERDKEIKKERERKRERERERERYALHKTRHAADSSIGYMFIV